MLAPAADRGVRRTDGETLEQSTKFRLVVNLTTAEVRLMIPLSLLVRADQVIE